MGEGSEGGPGRPGGLGRGCIGVFVLVFGVFGVVCAGWFLFGGFGIGLWWHFGGLSWFLWPYGPVVLLRTC